MGQVIREMQDDQTSKLTEVEQTLRTRERELSELKDAYKEKHRKCSAWEKVSVLRASPKASAYLLCFSSIHI
jgi:hypothetical protein